MNNEIKIRGARTHNLKNINLDIPREKLVVLTGLSGSGKSSLAFDTLYAEGQRRYVESLSAYARQFLQLMEKPDVDTIEGLSPAISIEQKATSHNPRSTVGTVTEIHDYLRLLFARVGKTISPISGKLVKKDDVADVINAIQHCKEGTKIIILTPFKQHVKRAIEALQVGDYKTAFEICLVYYDKTYHYGEEKREKEKVIHYTFEKMDLTRIAKTIIDHDC